MRQIVYLQELIDSVIADDSLSEPVKEQMIKIYQRMQDDLLQEISLE